MLKKVIEAIELSTKKHSLWWNVVGVFILIAAGAVVFYARYPYAYTSANFYAEDGTTFVRNILDEGFLRGPLSFFNGYLVLGQYLITEIAFILNSVAGNGLVTLPKAIAITSYAYWGLVVTLPYMLFRKKLGLILGLILMTLLAIVPMGGYDYAVFGTIGNLKFSFFFIAAVLLIYRNDRQLVRSKYQFIAVDLALLLCVLTNVVVIALLPAALWRYRRAIIDFVRHPHLPSKKLNFSMMTLVTLLVLSAGYVFAVVVKGIPKTPGYLDEPLMPSAIIAILFRGSLYGILFPINGILNNAIVVVLLVSTLLIGLTSRYKPLVAFAAAAILLNVAGFVYNRPGVTHYYATYTADGGPGLFFYAGTLLFVFVLVFILKDWFGSLGRRRIVVLIFVVIASLAILPAAGRRNDSYTQVISSRPTFAMEVSRVCAQPDRDGSVELGIYPAINWTVTYDRALVCRR